jgi:hypothetical protein
MKCFLVTIDGDDDRYGKGFYPFIANLDPQYEKYNFILKQGTYIETWDEKVALYSCQEGNLDTKLVNDSNWLIFSDEAIVVFGKYNIQGFQYLPINVFAKDGQRLNGYNYVANITKKVQCLHLGKSVYELFGEERPDRKGQIRDLKTAVLSQQNFPNNLDVFRLSEAMPLIIVSERFCDLYKKYNFTGLSFDEVEVV